MKAFFLETYKIVLTFVLVGLVAQFIQQRQFENNRALDEERARFEVGMRAFEKLTEVLSVHRVWLFRVSDENFGAESLEGYNASYLAYTRFKGAFILQMQHANQTESETARAFAELNVSLINFDVCIQQEQNTGNKIPCNIQEQAKQASLASIDLESMIFGDLFQ